MKSCFLFIALSCVVTSTFAIKCYVCTSLTVEKGNKELADKDAYRVRSCQKVANDSCDSSEAIKIGDYYQGDNCRTVDKSKVKQVDCAVGCAKIVSNVVDRGADISRVTRQCAFYDKDIVGKYMDTPGFKRTGAGSDKVANWFYYCSGELCNAASGLSRTSAIMIASFYGVLAFLYH